MKAVSLTRDQDRTIPTAGLGPDQAADDPLDRDAGHAPDLDDDGAGPDSGGSDGAGAEVDVDDGEGDGDLVSGLSWPKVAVLGAALLFLGFALATFVDRNSSPSAGSVDVGFYQDMISHHDQALRIASLELTNGSDPIVRGYAQEVTTFQSYEIGVMERTLHEWGYGRADRSDQAMAWMGMPVPVDHMPGLQPEAAIARLRGTHGRAADALFLDMMAKHHRGGLHMAEYAATQAHDADVRVLAARMARNQSIEINEFAMTAEQQGLPIHIDRVPVPGDDRE